MGEPDAFIRIAQREDVILTYFENMLRVPGSHKDIDQIEIIRSNGNKEIYSNPATDRYLIIIEGTGILPESFWTILLIMNKKS